MLKSSMRGVFLLCLVVSATAQKERTEPASAGELAAIAARGRALYGYDVAAWHATDAFLAATSPQDRQKAPLYIARKDGEVWEVVFGTLDADGKKFLIAYEARQGNSPTSFAVKSYQPAKEDSSFYLAAARALVLVRGDFKGEDRRYNKSVLPADNGRLYVYVCPAQTDAAVWPLGGDVRYLVSADGSTIVERHRMHNDILQFGKSPEMKEVTTDFHIAVIDEVPEDSDVFFTMSRQPAVNHIVATKHFVYFIPPDGQVIHSMTMEAFKKAVGSK